jgi:hypothetical protein
MAAVLGVIGGAVLVRVGEGLTDLGRGTFIFGNEVLRSGNNAPDAAEALLLMGRIFTTGIALLLAASALATASIGAGLLATSVVILVGQPAYATIVGVVIGVAAALRCFTKLAAPVSPAN